MVRTDTNFKEKQEKNKNNTDEKNAQDNPYKEEFKEAKEIKGEKTMNNTMNILRTEYNVRDTKKYYSDINNIALRGIEVITFKGTGKEEGKVSHVNSQFMDYLLDLLEFEVIDGGFDEESGVYSMYVGNGINIYGEGKTREDAIEDLINSLVEYTKIYLEKIEIFSLTQSVEEQVYMAKLLRCVGDRTKIKKALRIKENYAHGSKI